LTAFIIQIRKKGTTTLLADVEVGAVKRGLQWSSLPYIFEESIKTFTYQVRTATKDINGNASVFSNWVNETAGDNSFGTAHSWTTPVASSISSLSTSLLIGIELNVPPIDFQRIEIYVRSTQTTAGHPSWEPDIIRTETSFDYPWVGTRNSTRYVYAKAFDKSGNESAIVEIGSGSIVSILPGDMDEDPPTLSTVTVSLES
jgi:hypothetical protein